MTAVKAARFVPRAVAQTILAVEESEGARARARRGIGKAQSRNFSPFIMFDHFSTDGSGGFPDHPHRGQESVTYMIKGSLDHEDFTGKSGTVGPGDLQFMTAGRGVMHAEMPRINEDGETPEGMQLWIDLPKELKSCEPRYRDLRAKEIPIVRPSEKVEIKVISGETHGVESVRDLAYTPVWFFDFKIQPGGSVRQELPKGWNSLLYIVNGSLAVNANKPVDKFHTLYFSLEGDGVDLAVPADATEETHLVLIAGQVLDQPIVQYGPFVETTNEKISKAFSDFHSGINGFERAVNWKSKIGKRG